MEDEEEKEELPCLQSFFVLFFFLFSKGMQGAGWRDGEGEGKHPIVWADSELGRTGVFKSLRPFNSTLLTAGCLLQQNKHTPSTKHKSEI